MSKRYGWNDNPLKPKKMGDNVFGKIKDPAPPPSPSVPQQPQSQPQNSSPISPTNTHSGYGLAYDQAQVKPGDRVNGSYYGNATVLDPASQEVLDYAIALGPRTQFNSDTYVWVRDDSGGINGWPASGVVKL